MYELVKYEELEEQRAFRTGQSRETEQKLTEVQPQEPEKKLTETQSQEPGKKLAADKYRVENGLVMAEVQLDGQRKNWRFPERETGTMSKPGMLLTRHFRNTIWMNTQRNRSGNSSESGWRSLERGCYIWKNLL